MTVPPQATYAPVGAGGLDVAALRGALADAAAALGHAVSFVTRHVSLAEDAALATALAVARRSEATPDASGWEGGSRNYVDAAVFAEHVVGAGGGDGARPGAESGSGDAGGVNDGELAVRSARAEPPPPAPAASHSHCRAGADISHLALEPALCRPLAPRAGRGRCHCRGSVR